MAGDRKATNAIVYLATTRDRHGEIGRPVSVAREAFRLLAPVFASMSSTGGAVTRHGVTSPSAGGRS